MASVDQVISSVPKQLLIGGEWRDAEGGKTLDVTNPATGEVLCAIADASVADGAAALDAAVAAQASWAKTAPRDRSEMLRAAFELLVERTEEFALLMTLEMGKPLAEARGEVAYGAEFFRWFAEEAVRVHGRYAVAPNGLTRLVTMQQPVGPVFAITPWNFPLAMGTRKIGPAIAAGCTSVVKPAHETPLTMLALAGLLQEVGVPAGVVNVVTTSTSSAVSGPIINDPRLRKLTFTGSTAVGKKLVEQSASQLLRLSMELGGNAPFIVFEDADLDAAADGAIAAKYRNSGQTCVCANRFFVHEKVYDAFAAKLAERVRALAVGPGTEPGVAQGPLINAEAVAKVEEHIADATARGASIAAGGRRHSLGGTFFEPTVLTRVTPDAKIFREETFGPVAPLIAFSGEAEVIELANRSEYGLASYFYARDLGRVWRVAEALEYGMVGVNTGLITTEVAPFGGVKQSGLGREGSMYGIDEYVEVKYVAFGGLDR